MTSRAVSVTVNAWTVKAVTHQLHSNQGIHGESLVFVRGIATKHTTTSKKRRVFADNVSQHNGHFVRLNAGMVRRVNPVIATWLGTGMCTLNFTIIPMLPKVEVTCWSTEWWLRSLWDADFAHVKKYTTKMVSVQTTVQTISSSLRKQNTTVNTVGLLGSIPHPLSQSVWKAGVVTAYDSDKACTGKWSALGITSSGTKPFEGITAACDRKRKGTWVSVARLGLRLCEDVGGLIDDRDVDVYMTSHKQAEKWGVQIVRS